MQELLMKYVLQESFSALFLTHISQELRWQDYSQGRKTSSTTFGAPAGFGAPQATTGLFGAQPAQQPTQTSAFGTPATNTGFGTFGNPTPTQPAAAPASTGAFGGGAFGQPQQQQTAGFGTFGATTQPQQPQQGNSLFGGGAFGAAPAKPAGGFAPFGGGGGGEPPLPFRSYRILNYYFSHGDWGLWWQYVWAATATATTPAATRKQPIRESTAAGYHRLWWFWLVTNYLCSRQMNLNLISGTNNTNTAKPSIFGTQPAAAQPTTTAFGTFGNTQQQNQQPQPQPSLFGNTGGGIFGNTQQQPQQQQPNQPAGNPRTEFTIREI